MAFAVLVDLPFFFRAVTILANRPPPPGFMDLPLYVLGFAFAIFHLNNLDAIHEPTDQPKPRHRPATSNHAKLSRVQSNMFHTPFVDHTATNNMRPLVALGGVERNPG